MSNGKFAVEIGGAAVTVPGVYTVPDKSAMVAQRGVPARAMAIVASAKGGTVGGITRVTRGDEARLLRSGIGAQMARAAFAHGMREVFFVRADAATPATLDLGSSTLYALNPGQASNALQAKTVQNGDRTDALDLYLKDASGAEQDETYRMVGPLLDVTYVGSGTSATGEIVRENDETDSVTLTLTATGDSGAALRINSNAVPTVAELIEAINRSGSWTARGICPPAVPVNVAEQGTVVFKGDGQGTVYGGARLIQLLLTANSRMAGCMLADTGGNGGGVQANITLGGPVNGLGNVRRTGNYEFFGGGEDGPQPNAASYIAALRLLEQVPVTGIALGTGETVASAALVSHLLAMSGVKERKERYGGAGIAPTLNKAAFIAQSSELALLFSDVERMVVAGNGPYDVDMVTGGLREQHGAVLAAAMIAMKVSTRPEEPLTNKGVRFTKLRHSFNTEDLEDLIEAGVAPVNYDQEQGRNLIVQGLTTYTVDTNVASRKLAAVDAVDYLNKKIRQRVTALSIGKVADEARVKVITQSVKALLNEEIRSTRNPNGVLFNGIDPDTLQPLPAWRDLVAVFDGADLVGVDFDCNLVGEIAYVRVRPRFTPARIEARA